MAGIILDKLSRSSSVMGSKDDQLDERGKFESMMVYLQIANALSTRFTTFDAFSNISHHVRIDECIVAMFIIGSTYAFMDYFIKQYTGKLDFNQSLNPMLRGVNYGVLLQVIFWILVFGTEAGYALHFLLASFPSTWSKCKRSLKKSDMPYNSTNSTNSTRGVCVSSKSVIMRCYRGNFTSFTNTSAYAYFRDVFYGNDKVIVTERSIAAAIIWTISFFLAVLSAFTLMKLLKLWIYFNLCSLFFTMSLSMMIDAGEFINAVIASINLSGPYNVMNVLIYLPFTHGVGMIGVYDFGCMSVYTVTDNAVVVYTISWIFINILRSALIRVVFNVMNLCVSIDQQHLDSSRLKLFGIIPLVTDLIHLNKTISLYIYMNLATGLLVNLTVTIATTAKLIQGQFRKVKDIYIVGIICITGFCSTQAMAVYADTMTALKSGATLASLYLGAYKLIIVIYLYGITRFSMDVEFWLGFKPTIFWKVGWISTPFILITYVTQYIIAKVRKKIDHYIKVIIIWLSITLFVVVIAQIKTIISYILKNNIVAAFRHSKKYGPPDVEMRKQRKHYDANARFRKCVHICTLLDDRLDCSHEQQTEAVGLTDIYREERRSSTSVLELDVLKQD